MPEITDAEAAEVLWASSEQGKAAVKAAWERVRHIAGPYDTYEHQGPGGEISKAGGIQVQVDMADVSAIVWAAHQAAEAERGELAYAETARRHLTTLEVLMTPGAIKGEHSYDLTLLRWATGVGEFLKVIAEDGEPR